MPQAWNDHLHKKLTEEFDPKTSKALLEKYAESFPLTYKDEYDADIAVIDIKYFEKLSNDSPLKSYFYYDNKNKMHLRLYQWFKPIPLSDVLPLLENLGLRTEFEVPSKITLNETQSIWLSDITAIYEKEFDIKKVKSLFQEALEKIYFGLAEDDGFNKLVLDALLSWREITILRTYAKYLRQVGFRFTQAYIEKTLVSHADITKNLIELFHSLHDPAATDKNNAIKIEKNILKSLDTVTSLDEDKILRRMLELIKATLRTNYYQTDEEKESKSYLAIKLNSRTIPELPLPMPLYEIFVYSPRFEAIHLRNTKVARGGLRWSDRPEDFRTEVLGLMKAQVVKNAVIVPSGSKGGFVLKALSHQASRDEIRTEVVACYKNFIRGLLDLTDNIKDGKFIPPENVVCYDDTDPYLVVAADKGTATFSDIANGISKEYDFWLGDAFASGGSAGYDHKKMGITAKGAWESIKRHFREHNVDLEAANINVVGIGDMSGDVFGNGMLYSNRLKLVGAFDHRNIFIDPDPDPELSYYERLRIFDLPTSSWEDYNQKLISKGGGIFKRSLKSIDLTPEMKQIFGVDDASLTPAELIRVLLKAPVDLLFNGGIGTYVKARTESNSDAGDRSNDYTRINGEELRCKVVGEGGNLGFTQLGRIEYAMKGGLINTDFIDNSAGVDCSDHEVNLKILLNHEVQKGKLTEKSRNELLASLTQEISSLVLLDNYNQALAMSYAGYTAKKHITLHTQYIKELEAQGLLNRQVEFLPDDRQLAERKAQELGLTRPELAVLLAYTKINIKQEILKSDLPEDSFIIQLLGTAFPPTIHNQFKHAMTEHRLKRDIIATQLSNKVVNEMGITFVYRSQVETGATPEEIVRAHAVASHIFGTSELQKQIESLDFKIPLRNQYDMFFNIRHLLRLATRWFLHENRLKGDLQKIIDHYAERIKSLEDIIPVLMGGTTKEYLDKLTVTFAEAGLSKEFAQKIGTIRAIYTALNIVEVATINKFDLVKTAKVYFAAGERINLLWFRDQIGSDNREGLWNTLARLNLRDQLDLAQRTLTIAILSKNGDEPSATKLVDQWLANNERMVLRWERLLSMLHTVGNVDYTMFFIAIRELLGYILATE